MEFWGLEVKPGTTVKCEPGDDYILHLSQAALGESKKASDNALMYVKVDDKKLAIGTLSAEKNPQIQFDLVFEKEFQLSHTSKVASVFFSGYKVHQPAEGDEMDLDSEEDEEDEEEEEMNIPVIKENGKAEGKEKEQKGQGKAGAAASKSNDVAKHAEKVKEDTDDSDEDETDDSDEDEGLSPEEGDIDGSSEEDSSEDEDEEEEETPKKPEVGKKKAAVNTLKTPASDKKAKVATPSAQKTGGKKGTHVATPHPAKQASKTAANNDKSKEKSPKSGGSIPCKSCSKTFSSETALQAHSKAKKH